MEERFLTWQYLNIMLTDLMMRVSMYMLMTLLPLYIIEKGFIMIAGLSTTVFMLVAVVFRPISGKLVDKQGRVAGIIIGAVVFFLATLFISFNPVIWLLLILRGIQGLGFSFFGTAVMTLATDIIPESRMSEGIGYLGLTQTIGRAFAPTLALSIKDAFGYQAGFLAIFGITSLTVCFGLMLIIRKKKTSIEEREVLDKRNPNVVPDTAQIRQPFWQKIVEKNAVKPAVLMMIITFATSCVGTFLVAHAIRQGIENPGLFFTANAITIGVARLFVGKISQKHGSIAVLMPGIALLTLSIVMMYSPANMTLLIISGALYGLGFGMVQPEINSLCVLLAQKEQRGLANSTFFMAMDLGNAFGAFAWGVFADQIGLGDIFLAAAFLTSLSLIALLVLHRRNQFQTTSV